VAAGSLDGFWEQGLSPWDVAAGIILVEEAGGMVSRYDGSAHLLAGKQILAAPKELHAKMVEVLQSVKR
jgi:myo-inositol-1(or 4)-monophosphatase